MAVGGGEFFKGKARNLGDDIIDRWLERRRGHAARDFIAQFIEREPNGQFRRDFRNRETGRLGCQRRRARHARIHLDDDHAAIFWIDGELYVRAAGIHSDFT